MTIQLRALSIVVACCGLLFVGCEGDNKPKDDAAKTKKKSGKKKKKKAKKKKADDAAAPSSAKAKNDDGSIPAPKPGEIPQFTVGAWSKYKTSTGLFTWAVLEKRATQILIDANVRGRLNIDIQAWVDVPDVGDVRTSKIIDIKYRLGGGAVQAFKGDALSGQAALYDRLIRGVMPKKFEGLPQEDVTVEAGTFRGCYKSTSTEEFMGHKTEQTVWTHPAVPPPSMVQMHTVKDGRVYELVEYGKTGAKPSL